MLSNLGSNWALSKRMKSKNEKLNPEPLGQPLEQSESITESMIITAMNLISLSAYYAHNWTKHFY